MKKKHWPKDKLLQSYPCLSEDLVMDAQTHGFPLIIEKDQVLFTNPVSVLDRHQIQSQCSAFCPQGIHITPCIDSTSTFLKTHAYSLCVAEWQSAGYGRKKQAWLTPFGCCCLFSYRWSTAQALAPSFSLYLCYQWVVFLNHFFPDLSFQFKWPNDIFLNGYKCAGLLIESWFDHTSNQFFHVLGFGCNVNVFDPPDSNPKKPWTSIAKMTGHMIDRTDLLCHLISVLHMSIQTFSPQTFSDCLSDLNHLHWLDKRCIRAQYSNRLITGRVSGINHSGALMLTQGENTRSHHCLDEIQPLD